MRNIVLGNEAVAQGALDSGISGVYAYPGTPSTEITEYIQKKNDTLDLGLHCQWSANEKTALESALGMSYAGKRVLVAMKHVGLNVAMDAFMNMAISGVNGGLVIVVADDPSMHSSQNEQDSRYLAHFAKIPIFEPSNQQEAYDGVRHCFNISEELQLPVLVRLVTRLAHSRSVVSFNTPDRQKDYSFPESTERFKLIPSRSVPRYEQLISKQISIAQEANESAFNHLSMGTDYSWGIIASGIAYNYLMENFPNSCPYPVLKISQYPIPHQSLHFLFEKCEKILVIEEGYPFIEELISDDYNLNTKVKGKFTGHFDKFGELTPDKVAIALGKNNNSIKKIPSMVKSRPPQLCEGCSHIDTFNILNELKSKMGDKRIFGDIGCYALGALPPYNTLNTLIDMGASITMAKGAADAGLFPSIAVIGDSTFTHSGMTGLLDCVNDKSNVTIIILDNAAVAMTGGQISSATSKLKNICVGLGVEKEHVKVIEPLSKNHQSNLEIVNNELYFNGVSVVIAQRACVRLPAERIKAAKEVMYV